METFSNVKTFPELVPPKIPPSHPHHNKCPNSSDSLDFSVLENFDFSC